MKETAARIFATVEKAVSAVAGLALMAMMLVVVYDIVGRTLSLWHVLSTVEQTTLYMMLLGFFGLVRCFRAQGNIVVDVATQSLPAAHVRRIDAFWALLAGIVLLPLGYASLADGLVLHGYGQRSEVLGISPLVHHAIAGFGLSAAALVSLLTAWRLAFGRETPRDGGERPADPVE